MTKIVFFGNERLISGLKHTTTPILNGLVANGYDVVAVVSHDSDSTSRNKRDLEVASVAQSYDIPIFTPRKPIDIIEELRAFGAEIGILVAYGRIIPQSIINLFPMGIVNIHPSLLPQYRGSTPIETALLNGDSVTGVSIMQLTAGMDEGPVYAQEPVSLHPTISKDDTYQLILNHSTNLFFKTLPQIISGELTPTPQDNDAATYTKMISKSDSEINWNEDATTIERKIRAYRDWPQTRTTLGEIAVIVTGATLSDTKLQPGEILHDKSNLTVGTGNGSLNITSLKPLGKKEMPIQAFLSGYKI